MTEKFKTDVRLPSQIGPLEGQPVDNARGGDETGLAVTLLGNMGERKSMKGTVTSSVGRLF